MKRIVKYLIYRSIAKPIYSLLRGFYLPSEKMRRRLRFIGKFRVNSRDGKKFYLYNNAFHLENHIYWLGIDAYPWERMTRRIWIKLCRESSSIFDIGANSGIYAILAKVYNAEAEVHAFEPQPNVYRVLEKNNELNEFDIHCVQLALSNQAGRQPFYNYGPGTFTTENTTGGSLNREWIRKDRQSILVDVKRLENYIEENSIAGINLIKIDVETLEYEVLLGYGRYLEQHEPVIILEIQDREIGINVESLLNSGRYAYFNIYEQSGLFRVSELGNSGNNLNYLLCPHSKLDKVKEFIIAE